MTVILVIFVTLTQATIILKEELQLRKSLYQWPVGKPVGVFSFLYFLSFFFKIFLCASHIMHLDSVSVYPSSALQPLPPDKI